LKICLPPVSKSTQYHPRLYCTFVEENKSAIGPQVFNMKRNSFSNTQGRIIGSESRTPCHVDARTTTHVHAHHTQVIRERLIKKKKGGREIVEESH
jgi:hypothetical protein